MAHRDQASSASAALIRALAAQPQPLGPCSCSPGAETFHLPCFTHEFPPDLLSAVRRTGGGTTRPREELLGAPPIIPESSRMTSDFAAPALESTDSPPRTPRPSRLGPTGFSRYGASAPGTSVGRKPLAFLSLKSKHFMILYWTVFPHIPAVNRRLLCKS